MFRQSNVLFPTDFSHYSMYALKYAIALTRKYGGKMIVAHVLDEHLVVNLGGVTIRPGTDEYLAALESMKAHAEARLVQTVQTCLDNGVPAVSRVLVGHAPEEIIRLAQEEACYLIALSTHGRTGLEHLMFGSCCEKVVRMATVPVLCIKHPERDFLDEDTCTVHPRRILFPTDFSAYAERTLPYAQSLCREFGAKLILFHATEYPVLMPEFLTDRAGIVEIETEAMARRALEELAARTPDIPVEILVRLGVPHREIVTVVEEADIDFIVVPTHGHSGIAHLLFGGIAEKVVRLAKCPVLAVRPVPVPEPLREKAEKALNLLQPSF